MSSFKSIKKYTYETTQDELVQLIEYAICTSKDTEKIIIFKFQNTITQDLYSIKFKVSQYDSSGDLIQTSSLLYDGFMAGPGEEFVPDAKFIASKKCETISVELEEATFEKMRYLYGTCSDIILDEKNHLTTKDVIKQPKKKKLKKHSRKAKKHRYFMKKERKIKAKAVNFFTVLFSLLAIGFVIYGSYKVNTQKDIMMKDSVLYKETDDGSINVVGFNGKNTTIKIPEKVQGKTVSRINAEAFKDNDIIEKVYIIAASLVIDSSAFENCTKLTYVSITGEATINSYAFKDCKSLIEFDAEDAVLYASSLAGDQKLDKLVFNSFSAKSFGDLFNLNNRLIPEMNLVSFNIPYVKASYFRNIDSMTLINFINRCEEAIEEEKEVYDETYEYYISNSKAYVYNYIDSYETTIKIPDRIKNCDVIIEAYTFYNSNIANISFYGNVTISKTAFYNCPYLKSVEITSANVKLESEAFVNCSISNFRASNSTLAENVLLGLDGLVYLEFMTTNAKTLGELFGKTNSQIPASLETIIVQKIADPETFFDGIDSLAHNIVVGSSQNVKLNGITYYYDKEKDKYYAKLFDESSIIVVIPEKIDGKEIDRIEALAFNNSKIESLEIKANNLTIEDSAFENCSSLKQIVISGTNITFSKNAFSGCKNVTTISITNSTINADSLSVFENLQELEIKGTTATTLGELFNVSNSLLPGSLTKITIYEVTNKDKFLADVDQSFRNITIGNQKTKVVNGITYLIEGKSAYAISFDNSRYEVVIPATVDGVSVLGIRNGTFNNAMISSVKIEASKLMIDQDAFNNCNYLSSIEITGNEVTITRFSFNNCSNVSSFIAPKITIDAYALSSFTSLETLEINETKALSLGALFGLSNQTLPTSLKKVVINKVDNYTTFLSDVDRTTIDIKIGDESAKTINIDGVIYQIENNSALVIGCEDNSTTVTILNQVENYKVSSIERNAFAYCENIKTIIINAENIDIKCNAILTCYNLQKIEATGYAHFDKDSIFSCSALKIIDVPNGSFAMHAISGCEKLSKINFSDDLNYRFDLIYHDCVLNDLNSITIKTKRFKQGDDLYNEYFEFFLTSNPTTEIIVITDAT